MDAEFKHVRGAQQSTGKRDPNARPHYARAEYLTGYENGAFWAGGWLRRPAQSIRRLQRSAAFYASQSAQGSGHAWTGIVGLMYVITLLVDFIILYYLRLYMDNSSKDTYEIRVVAQRSSPAVGRIFDA